MKILIYLFDGVTALDAVGPYECLQRLPECQIVFVGKSRGMVRTGESVLRSITSALNTFPRAYIMMASTFRLPACLQVSIWV